MKRNLTPFLLDWLNEPRRKPLVLRGARQVGKTWLIRNLAEITGKHLIELNLERRPDFTSLFTTNDPQEIVTNISSLLSAPIDNHKSLLFIDEIQAAPHLLAKLRWFAEEMPELPVIAAGSLLDFALAEHEFSMPVGRISYAYLEPLSFEEFLDATGETGLCNTLATYDINKTIPAALHNKLSSALQEYTIIGGMPAAVSLWAAEKKLEAVSRTHADLLATYRDDFAKYKGRLSIDRLEEILSSIPRQLGQKFVYARANPNTNTPPMKQAIDLLEKARICHRVIATSANGLPLKAEAKERFFKAILLDCGLASAELGLSLHELRNTSELTLINRGAIAEQLVGMQLRALFPAFVPPALYYWQRTEKQSNAEIDYIIQHESAVIPIEVKAGTTGSLKSLHEFMQRKQKKLAVRINSDLPSLCTVETKGASYTLLSLPFYLIGQLHRLLSEVFKKI